MKWSKTLPRVSGWFWIREPLFKDGVWIGNVEGRSETSDGWLWMPDDRRIYLTPGATDECGDEPQGDFWTKWEWAGPISMPKE